jgi:peptide/nickel transport system ATP-binding protein
VSEAAARTAAPSPVASPTAILGVKDLRTVFATRDGLVRAVDGVSFDLLRGETLGVVGESGCGKSVTAMSIMRLLREPPARILAGSIRLEGRDLLRLSHTEMRAIRGNEISMIFQEPMTSLNPVLTIGRQIAEAYRVHQHCGWREAMDRAVAMLDLVRIPDATRRAGEYPHQLSGGMRQRVMIAMALACNPKVLIADEPTTALDVTIQAQILDLIVELQQRLGTTVMLITHNLGVVAAAASRVVVIYAGRKVEEAPTAALFRAPRHPYTVGLMGSVPRLGSAAAAHRRRLDEIPGTVASIREEIRGCAFAPRCALATDRCRAEAPPIEEQEPGHFAACWHGAEAERLRHG